jgi:HAD superfamily hydrolase (TIGR01509 family)
MAEPYNGLRPPLEAVFFDAGGTLVRLDFEWIGDLLAGLGVPAGLAELRRAEVRGRRLYDEAATRRRPAPGDSPANAATLEAISAYFAGMLEGAGCRHPLLEEAVAALFARQASGDLLWARLNEGAREAIDGARTLGLRVACISNSDGRAEEHLVQTGTREGLEFVVDSHLEGVEKPDPEIFRVGLARMGVAAERALYVGDIRSVDEPGARAAGMHFVLIDPFGDYAGDATPSIPSIGRLPEYLAARFATPVARNPVTR